jgi:hypothetical protein
MIGLKDSTLVNEIIKHLGYKTSKYIKVDPYVHFDWICNTIYTFFKISFESKFSPSMNFLVWQVCRATWCYELQCNGQLVFKKLNNSHKIMGK